MKCNAHICCLYFVTSNPGILQSPPLKLNFVPKFTLSYVVGQTWCGIIYLDVPLPTNWNLDSILCPECSSNLLLSDSEQELLEFHPSWFLLGQSLGLSMFAILSMDHRVLLIVPTNLPIWLLVLPPKNELNTFGVFIPRFLIQFYRF
jgi:hypothetical protein